MKSFIWKRFLFDAIIGGVLIAVVVFIAGILGSVIGGVLAGLPVRAGLSILLIKYYFGETAAIDAARGALFGVSGAVVFVVALNFLILKYKFLPSIGVAAILCIIATTTLYFAFGGA